VASGVNPPPPTARSPALHEAVEVPTSSDPVRTVTLVAPAAPGAPRGPWAPCGPAGNWPDLKSADKSEPFLTLSELTAPFLIFAPVTAAFLIFGSVTAFFLSFGADAVVRQRCRVRRPGQGNAPRQQSM